MIQWRESAHRYVFATHLGFATVVFKVSTVRCKTKKIGTFTERKFLLSRLVVQLCAFSFWCFEFNVKPGKWFLPKRNSGNQNLDNVPKKTNEIVKSNAWERVKIKMCKRKIIKIYTQSSALSVNPKFLTVKIGNPFLENCFQVNSLFTFTFWKLKKLTPDSKAQQIFLATLVVII